MACEFTLKQLVEATQGQIFSGVEKTFIGVGTDTRQSLDKQIFVALKGDSFDAHDFLRQAFLAGAKCLVIHRETPELAELKDKVSILIVKDTLKALQDMARYWRRKISAKVFGITGSNGKTTTKEFTAAILSSQFKVHYSKGSYNNHWGVPLTLLGASKFTEAVIVEMGMNHAGELTQLSKIAEPDVVLCTTVGRAHIGNFEGGIQGIADAKEEIYLANPKAIKIFNGDNEYTLKMFERVSKLAGLEKTMVFSTYRAGSEVSLRANIMTLDELQIVGHIAGVKGDARVKVFGRHNVVNLMAAACQALVMKMEPELIWASFSRCEAQWGRNQLVRLENGPTVLFDAYNANPDSMSAMIKNLLELNIPSGARKIAVVGEMLELGPDAEKFHEEIGQMMGQSDFNIVWFIGASSIAFRRGFEKYGDGKTLYVSNTYEESLALNLRSMLNPHDVVVMKGSRGAKLEKVMRTWSPQFATY